jgi:hypothetical protein
MTYYCFNIANQYVAKLHIASISENNLIFQAVKLLSFFLILYKWTLLLGAEIALLTPVNTLT